MHSSIGGSRSALDTDIDGIKIKKGKREKKREKGGFMEYILSSNLLIFVTMTTVRQHGDLTSGGVTWLSAALP